MKYALNTDTQTINTDFYAGEIGTIGEELTDSYGDVFVSFKRQEDGKHIFINKNKLELIKNGTDFQENRIEPEKVGTPDKNKGNQQYGFF